MKHFKDGIDNGKGHRFYFLWNSLGDSFGWCWIYQSRTIHTVAHFWVQLHPEGHSSLGAQKLGNILCCYVHNLCSLCNPRTILLTCPVFLEIDCFKFLELRSHVVDSVKCQQRFISYKDLSLSLPQLAFQIF